MRIDLQTKRYFLHVCFYPVLVLVPVYFGLVPVYFYPVLVLVPGYLALGLVSVKFIILGNPTHFVIA